MKMQPSPQTQVRSATDEQVFSLPVSEDGSTDIPELEASSRSNSTGTDVAFPETSATAESKEEKLPTRTVTWNTEIEVLKKKNDDDEEETLSMLGKRKLKAWHRQMRIEKRNEEKRSWKLWFWSQGCPCLDWSPLYIFLGNDDQSSMAAASTDQSSMATSTTVDEEDVGDDDSSVPSCSRVGSMLDGSIVSIEDENISDVSSNSSDGSVDDETDDEDEDDDEYKEVEALKVQAPVPKPKEDTDIQKDWSREGLSTNVISDMDVFMEAMRS